MKKVSFFLIIIGIALLGSCNNREVIEESKTKCFDRKLASLQTTELYSRIHKSFADTLPYFPSSKIEESQVDSAIFLNEAKTECLMLVLERIDKKRDLGFGSTRVYRGELIGGQWRFKRSMSIDFEGDYFEKYEDNSFENLSTLARGEILIHGAVDRTGCDIDEHYWFVEMKD
jgi:hypothetical protein